MRFRRFFITCLCLLTAGCASTITAFTNRPITSDKLTDSNEHNKLKTLSGDRRLVRTFLIGAPENYVVCAETQADAIASRAAQSNITITDKASVQDSATESLLLTYARTQVSDVTRQLAWQICNAHLNGVYDATAYATRLDALTHNAMAVLMANAVKPDMASLQSPGLKQPVAGATITPLNPTPIPPAPAVLPRP